MSGTPPLIAHVIHRLQVGGLENGLVNLINNTPEGRYRHVIICMTDYTEFRNRLHDDVPCYALHKREGKDPAVYFRLWQLLRELKPDLLHTRNIGTLECVLPAVLSGVQYRIHGEHGRDIHDIHGKNRKYNLLRRVFSPWIDRFIALSKDLESWLSGVVGIPAYKIVQLYNGVDTEKFFPAIEGRAKLPVEGFGAPDTITIGTVGRMQAEKDPLNLVKAFLLLAARPGVQKDRLRLVMVGDGPLREEAVRLLNEAGFSNQVWIPGDRHDVPELLRALDIFVLPSLGEGISNTILEAMASGLPVVATRVGGNPELVVEGSTGVTVPAADPEALATSLARYVADRSLVNEHGIAGRRRVEETFSLQGMVDGYLSIYDQVTGRA